MQSGKVVLAAKYYESFWKLLKSWQMKSMRGPLKICFLELLLQFTSYMPARTEVRVSEAENCDDQNVILVIFFSAFFFFPFPCAIFPM